jgi:Dolichyl-phosphate-mannose-protein mannosyltransferase
MFGVNRLALVASAIFTAALIIAGGFLAVDAFRPAPLQHALMNVEGIVALSFIAILFLRSSKPGITAGAQGFGAWHAAWALAAILVVTWLALTPVLRTPFLYDDYTHITDASQFTWRSVAHQFGPVAGRGLFFRPVGFFFYWLNYLWARANPEWWHAASIVLHAICSCLMYALCREVGLSRLASLGGALLFGLSGVSAEAVAWIDARFDLMTTALVLVSLIFVCRYTATARIEWLAGALLAGACAMLCKESGFCLPFLVASLALLRDRKDWKRIARAATFAGVLAVVLFAYRWWALGGIGGYSGAAGVANVIHFNFVRTVDALFLRQWAVLFFPFNWSTQVSPILRAALAATPFLLVAWAWMARPPRSKLMGCVAFILAAGLPVQHLLLIGPDLGGSRILYLGSVGWALLWAVVLDSIALDTMRGARRVVAAAAACVLLALQVSMLEHNLQVWRDTAELARAVCVAFGQIVEDSPGRVVVRGLPSTRNGAVFLQNGFPQCVEMNTGVTAGRIQSQASEPGVREFVWSEQNGRIEPVTGSREAGR